MDKDSTPEWLTPEEVAVRLKFSVKTIQRFCREGFLPAKKFGKRRWLINAAELEKFLSGPGGGPK